MRKKNIEKLSSSKNGSFISITKDSLNSVFNALVSNKVGTKLLYDDSNIFFNIDMEYFLNRVKDKALKILESKNNYYFDVFRELCFILIHFDKFDSSFIKKTHLVNTMMIETFETLRFDNLSEKGIERVGDSLEIVFRSNSSDKKMEILRKVQIEFLLSKDKFNSSIEIYDFIDEQHSSEFMRIEEYPYLFLINSISKNISDVDVKNRFLELSLKNLMGYDSLEEKEELSSLLEVVDLGKGLLLDDKYFIDYTFSKVGIYNDPADSIILSKISGSYLEELNKVDERLVIIIMKNLHTGLLSQTILDIPGIKEKISKMIFTDFSKIYTISNYENELVEKQNAIQKIFIDEGYDVFITEEAMKYILSSSSIKAILSIYKGLIPNDRFQLDIDLIIGAISNFSNEEIFDNLLNILNNRGFTCNQKVKLISKVFNLIDDTIEDDLLSKIISTFQSSSLGDISNQKDLLKIKDFVISLGLKKNIIKPEEKKYTTDELFYNLMSKNKTGSIEQISEVLKSMKKIKWGFSLNIEQLDYIYNSLNILDTCWKDALSDELISVKYKKFSTINEIELFQEKLSLFDDESYNKNIYLHTLNYTGVTSPSLCQKISKDFKLFNNLKESYLKDKIFQDILHYLEEQVINYPDNGPYALSKNEIFELIKKFDFSSNFHRNKIMNHFFKLFDNDIDGYKDFIFNFIENIPEKERCNIIRDYVTNDDYGITDNIKTFKSLILNRLPFYEFLKFIDNSELIDWCDFKEIFIIFSKNSGVPFLESNMILLEWALKYNLNPDKKIEEFKFDELITNILTFCSNENIDIPDYLINSEEPLVQKRLSKLLISYNFSLDEDGNKKIKDSIESSYIEFLENYSDSNPTKLIEKIYLTYKSGYFSINDIIKLTEDKLSTKNLGILLTLHSWKSIFKSIVLSDDDFLSLHFISDQRKGFLKVKDYGLNIDTAKYDANLIKFINREKKQETGANEYRNGDYDKSFYEISEKYTAFDTKVFRSSNVYACYNNLKNNCGYFCVPDTNLGEKSDMKNINRLNKATSDIFSLKQSMLKGKKHRIIFDLTYKNSLGSEFIDIINFLKGLKETIVGLKEDGVDNIIILSGEIFPVEIIDFFEDNNINLFINRGFKEIDTDITLSDTKKLSDAKEKFKDLGYFKDVAIKSKISNIDTLINNLNEDIEVLEEYDKEHTIESSLDKEYFLTVIESLGYKTDIIDFLKKNPKQLEAYKSLIELEINKFIDNPISSSTLKCLKISELSELLNFSDSMLSALERVYYSGSIDGDEYMKLFILNKMDINQYINNELTIDDIISLEFEALTYNLAGSVNNEILNKIISIVFTNDPKIKSLFSNAETWSYYVQKTISDLIVKSTSSILEKKFSLSKFIQGFENENSEIAISHIKLLNDNSYKTMLNICSNVVKSFYINNKSDIKVILKSLFVNLNDNSDIVARVKDIENMYIGNLTEIKAIVVELNNEFFDDKNYELQLKTYEFLNTGSTDDINIKDIKFLQTQWIKSLSSDYKFDIESSDLDEVSDDIIITQDFVQNTYIDFLNNDFFDDETFLSYLPKSGEPAKLFKSITTPLNLIKYGDNNQSELDLLNNDVAKFIKIKNEYLSLLDKLESTKSEKKADEISKKIELLNFEEESKKITLIDEKFKKIWASWYKDVNVKLSMFNSSFLSKFIEKQINSGETIKHIGDKEFDFELYEKLNSLFILDKSEWTIDDLKFVMNINDNKFFIISIMSGIDFYNSNICNELFNVEGDSIDLIFENISNFDIKKYQKIKKRFMKELNIQTLSANENFILDKIIKENYFDLNNILKFVKFMKDYGLDLDFLHYFNLDLINVVGLKEYIKYFSKIINYLKNETNEGETFNPQYRIDEIKMAVENIDFVKGKLGGLNHTGRILFNTAKLKMSNIKNQEMLNDTFHAFSSASLNDVKALNISNKSETVLNNINRNLEKHDNYEEEISNNNYFYGKELYTDKTDGSIVIYELISPFDTRTYSQGYATSSCLTPDGLASNILTDMSLKTDKWSSLLISKSKVIGGVPEDVLSDLKNLIKEFNLALVNSGKFDSKLHAQIKSIVNRYFYTTAVSAVWEKELQCTYDNMETNVKTFVKENGNTVRINKSEEYVVKAIKNNAKNGILYSQIKILSHMLRYYEENGNFKGYKTIQSPLYFTIGSGYSDISLETFNKRIPNRSSLLENTDVYTDAMKDQQFLVDSHSSYDFNNVQSILSYFDSFKIEDGAKEALESEIKKCKSKIISNLNHSTDVRIIRKNSDLTVKR